MKVEVKEKSGQITLNETDLFYQTFAARRFLMKMVARTVWEYRSNLHEWANRSAKSPQGYAVLRFLAHLDITLKPPKDIG